MIRPASPSDTPHLVELSRSTGVFKPLELEVLDELLSDYHADPGDHVAVVYENEGTVVGYVYYALATMTDRTYYLYWIAVPPGLQTKGIGSALLRHTEDDVRARGGRLLLIETSSLPGYAAARGFYGKHGYELAATLRDYYCDGDDMVVFRKHLTARAP